MEQLASRPLSARPKVASLLRRCCGSYTCSHIKFKCHFMKLVAAICRASWSVQRVSRAGGASSGMLSSIATNSRRGRPNCSRQCLTSWIQCKVGNLGTLGFVFPFKRLLLASGCSPARGGFMNFSVCPAKASGPCWSPVTAFTGRVTCNQAASREVASWQIFAPVDLYFHWKRRA